MKKIVFTILLFTIVMALTAPMFTAAKSIPTSKEKVKIVLEEKEFFDTFKYTKRDTKGTKIGAVKNLPQGKSKDVLADVLASVIKTVLGITGSLAFISFTYAGIMFITAHGDETQLSKAKKLIFWSIFALAIIATSYAITLGVSQLKF